MSKLILWMLLCTITMSALAQQNTASVADKNKKTPTTKVPDVLVTPATITREMVQDVMSREEAKLATPEQIDHLKTEAAATRQSYVSQYPHNFIPEPVSRPIVIDQESSREKRLIRLSAGTITTLVFSDMLGTPWFIKRVSLDCNLFTDGVVCEKQKEDAPTNTLKLIPKAPYAYGNVVVEMEDHAPIIFMLAAGQSNEVDVGIDVQISGMNPSAKPQTIVLEKVPEFDPKMRDFLDGVPPPEAKKLKVFGGKAEAWELGGFLYVRTYLNMLSQFINQSGNVDGLHTYKFSMMPSLLASNEGKTTTLVISGY